MGKLRGPVRAYVAVVTGASVFALAAALLLAPARSLDVPLAVALLLLATAAQAQVVHLSAKTKVSVGDTAIFAAVLTLATPAAMAVGAASTLAGLAIATKQQLFNRAFNAAGTALAAGASSVAFFALGGSGDVLAAPAPLAAAAAAYYLVKASVTDGVIALQTRQDPLRSWWASHRRELPFHAAMYLLGILAAEAAQRATWSVALFLVPIGLIYVALRETTRLRRRTKDAIIQLADLIDRRDPYTYGHSQRVAEHAERVARRLRIAPERVELITEAARMHDIGKVSTPDHILKKPGPLNEREWAEMRKHCENGHALLRHLADFSDGAELVLCHHERVDGRGYPRGVRGVDLAIEASIIAVCDAYDAMTSDRVYRAALTHEEVLGELRTGRGSQWHESAVDALLALMEEGNIVPASPRRERAVAAVV